MSASLLRCPMPECRRSLEEHFWSTKSTRIGTPCLHFVAAWSRPAGMVDAVLQSLDGEREFVIRNIRVRDEEVRRRVREADQEELAAVVRANLHVTEEPRGGAAFADRHERAAVCRDLAQIIAGPDPMLGGGTMR
ncbi:MAG: hypothetical protein OXG95_11135 [Chloroflexi bacterium]|nr:hypothetical protein [Chloroflexota bacterium]